MEVVEKSGSITTSMLIEFGFEKVGYRCYEKNLVHIDCQVKLFGSEGVVICLITELGDVVYVPNIKDMPALIGFCSAFLLEK